MLMNLSHVIKKATRNNAFLVIPAILRINGAGYREAARPGRAGLV